MKRRGIRLTLVNGLEASLLPVVKSVAELDLGDRAGAEVANIGVRRGGSSGGRGGSGSSSRGRSSSGSGTNAIRVV